MANFNRPFGSNTEAKRTDEPNKTPNTKKEESKTGETGSGVGDSADVKRSTNRSSNPASTEVQTQTKAPKGANKEVWQQAEAQVVSTFGGLDDEAKEKAVQARYDSMVASDKQVKNWAGNDREILGAV